MTPPVAAMGPQPPPAGGRRGRRGLLRCGVAAGTLLLCSSLSSRLGAFVATPKPSLRTASCRRGGVACGAAGDDLEDVILVPMGEDDVSLDDFTTQAQPVAPGDDFRPEAPAKPVGEAPPAPKRKLPKVGSDAATDSLKDSLRDGLSLTKTAADKPLGGGALGGKNRWLKGRGNAKRRKLEENTRLRQWLESSGVWVSESSDWGRQSSPVAMAIETREQGENEISGRGLVARRAINLYEEICRVPLDLLLTRETAIGVFGEECIPDFIGEYGAIALHLMYERYVKAESSFWEPYIAVLPSAEEIGASFAWPDDELDMLLNGTNLLYQSKFLRQKIGDEFKRLQDEIFAKNPDKFPADLFTEERYIWAYAILFSRAVRLEFQSQVFEPPPETVALVPYVDLINHNPGSDTYIRGFVDGVKLPLGMEQRQTDIVVTADRYYAEYEQIYISYGDKSNAQLLLLYGFSMERNTKNFAEVPLGQIMDEVPLAEEKRRVLQARGITEEVFPLYRDRYTNEMIAYLRLMILDPEDIVLSEGETYEEAMMRLDITRAFGETSERRAMVQLKQICEDMLAAFPTTVEEDEALISDRSMFELLPKNQRNALRVRYGEKMILRGTITTVDRVLNNLGKLSDQLKEEGRKYRKNMNSMWGRLGVDFDNPAIKAKNLEELMQELDI